MRQIQVVAAGSKKEETTLCLICVPKEGSPVRGLPSFCFLDNFQR